MVKDTEIKEMKLKLSKYPFKLKEEDEIMTSNIKAPCKGCIDRFLGCYAKCEKYNNYKNNLNAKNTMIREAKIKNNMFNDFKYESIRKMQRHAGRKY